MHCSKLFNAAITFCIISVALISCSPESSPNTNSATENNHAAFLLVNSPGSAQMLESTKQVSTGEGLAIGPVEYYNQGITDFEPALRRITTDKQVTLIWVISGLMDVPNIQKGITEVGFKGSVRYKLVSNQAAPAN